MKIAYGSYAMPTTPLEEAVPLLADIGYDGLEICISPKHVGAMPDQIDRHRRGVLKGLLEEHGMVVPALMVMGHLLAKDAAEHRATMDHVCEAVLLARDLGLREPPVIAVGIGGRTAEWDAQRDRLVELLGDYAALADREDFILAGEAHCNAAVDRSERIVWLLGAVAHPRIRLHFDIVHLFLAGEDVHEAVKTLLPFTAHTHITDAVRHPDGTFDLVLPGRGDLDAVAYVKAMDEEGWTDFITLEVSTRVWSQPDYDAVEAARLCYDALDGAFRKAGVPRG